MSKDTEEFFVTVYSRGGYDELMEITQDLRAKSISQGITQGGLSVWGPWSSYEAFAAIIDRYPRATFQGGSVHRIGLSENPMVKGRNAAIYLGIQNVKANF